jgi:uncharacterized membrane protein YhiD involved in acid resistance
MKDALLKLLEVNINQPVDLRRILTTFTVALLMGLLILFIYRITFRGVLFNRSFGTALLMIALVTALIIMPISSNIVLSLGMVGALSIVRFRTALKDPLDIVFMFWAIAIGLTTGAGFFELAIVGGLILAAIMFLVTTAQVKGQRKPFLVVIRYNDQFKGDLRQFLPKYSLKSKTATAKGFELVVEISLRKQDTHFIEQLQKTDGIISASLVRYSGDYN